MLVHLFCLYLQPIYLLLLRIIVIFAKVKRAHMKDQPYKHPQDESHDIAAESVTAYQGKAVLPIIDNEDRTGTGDWLDRLPYVGPATDEERVASVLTAEEEFARSGEAINMEDFLRELEVLHA